MSLKSIGNLSNIFSILTSDVQNSTNAVIAMQYALRGMTVEQVEAAASTLGLDAAQTAVALSAVKMEAAEIATRLAMQGYNKEVIVSALTTAGFSEEQIAAAISTEAFAAAEGTATAATGGFATALRGLGAAMMANPITAIITAVLTLVTVFSVVNSAIENYKRKIKEAQQATEEAATVYQEETQSLNEYKNKIAELRQELDSGNLSEQEAYEKRQQLIGIQDELIDKIGNEAKSFDILHDSIENVNSALDNYSASQAKQLLTDNKDEFDKAIREMEKTRKYGNGLDNTIYSTYRSGIEENDKVINQVKRIFESVFGDDVTFKELGDGRVEYELNVDARSAVEGLSRVNDELYELDRELSRNGEYSLDEMLGLDIYGNTWQNAIAVSKKQAQEIIDTFGANYDNVIQLKIQADFDPDRDDDYTDLLERVGQFKSDYEKAIQEGNDAAAAEAYQNMQSLVPTFEEIDDESVRQYFLDLVNAFNELNSDSNLEIQLKAKLADDQDTLGNSIKNAVSQFADKNGEIDLYEILNLGTEYENSGKANSRRAVLSEEEQAWVNLKFAAESYGIAGDTTAEKVENLLKMMSQLGYVTFDSAEDIEIAAASFDTLKESASSVISEISNVQSILNSQANGKSISLADFSAEGMSDYQSALEYVNGTMQLNAEKCREIANAKAEEQIAIAETNKTLTQAQYLENARQIEQYRKKLTDANFENGETAESVQASIDALLDENSALAANCKQYDLLSASIKEAMGSYQHWLNAQNSSDYGDMADDAVSAIERIRDTFDSNSDIFGNFGSKKFDAAVDFIVPDSVDSDDLSAIESYMNNFKQYLKFDSNGDPDGLNIDQFLKNSVEAGLMNYSEDEGWTIAGQKSMEDFAEGLNLSSGVVQAFFDELQLKGAEFDWADEAIKSFGDLAIEANEAAEALRLIDGNDGLKIKVDVSDLSTTNEQITALDTTITEMNTLKSKVNVDPSEIEYANTVIQYCIAQKQLLSQPEVMRVDTTQCSEDVANVIGLLQQFQQAQNELEIVQSVGADTTNAKAKVDGLVAEIEALSPEVKTQLGLDTTSIDAIQESINELTADVMVTFGVNDEAIQGYNPETKQCEVIYDPNTDLLPESFDPLSRTVNYQANTKDLPTYFKPLTRTVRYVATGDTQGGSHRVNGTAQASGTANAGGNWGTASGGKTLVGELGREIVVDPHTGRWYTVGDNGAEFVDIPDGAIVFNHKQTESLLENGYVTGRAAALASGTAMVTGGYKPYKPKVTTPTTKTTTNQIKDATKAAEDLEEQLKDTLDEMKKTMDNVLNYFNHEMFLMEKNNKVVVRIVPKIDDGEVKTSLNHITDFDDFTKNQMENASQIVAIYKQMQETVHNQAEEYRKLGLDENSSEIQELQKQWWEYSDEITNSVVSAYETITGELENAIGLTDVWLNKAISEHDYGGIVQYTQDTINYYHRMQEAIHEEAEFYRSKGYSDASDEVSSLSKLWWEYYEEIKNATANAWQQVVDNANNAIDEITGLYDALHTAADEYAESGFITVSTFQEILSWGIQYLNFLKDENGQLVINEESIQRVIAARTEQMAVEQALAYVQQIQFAAQQNDTAALLNLANATTTASGATWDMVYAQLALMKASGQISDSLYNSYVQNINNMRALADSAKSGIGKVTGEITRANEAAKKALQEQSDALDDLLKYVEEMIKQEVENQVKAIEDQIDSMKDLIDLQKKSLDLEKEKDEYARGIVDKEKAIADLRKQLAALDLDDSREAAAKKAKLQEELSDKINDLSDYQSDHAYDAAADMLDQMGDAYEREKKKEIEILENTISSEEKLYQLAIDRISNHWDTLYQDLTNWVWEYGNITQNTLDEAWNTACDAIQIYGSYLDAVLQTQQQLASLEITSSNNSYTSGSTGDGDKPNKILGNTGDYDTSGSGTLSEVKKIVAQMKANSAQHHSEDAAGKLRLNKANLALGEQLASKIGRVVVRGNDGVWYLDKVGGLRLYDTYPYSTYHTGGIAGDNPTLKQKEIMAKLEKGEAIIPEKQQEGLYEILDANDTMLSKYGKLFSSVSTVDLFGEKMDEQLKKDSSQTKSMVENRNFNISVTAPVEVYPLQKLDAAEIQRLTKDISKHTVSKINEVFTKNGMDSVLNPLRPH